MEKRQINPPREAVDSISALVANRALTSETYLEPQLGSFVQGLVGDKAQEVVGIISGLNKSRNNLRQWFMGKYKETRDKLKQLAILIKEEAKRLNVTVMEYLTTLRRHLFEWVLRNSAVGSFTVSGVNGSISFRPNKITSKGTFEYGPLGASVSTINEIIGFLKVLPKISIEVSVEYGKP